MLVVLPQQPDVNSEKIFARLFLGGRRTLINKDSKVRAEFDLLFDVDQMFDFCYLTQQ